MKEGRESDETKKKILFAAKKEFAAKGFSGARMSSIAAIAGVNQALLYYYFESKENLYRSIFQNSLGEIPDKISKIIQDEINSWKPSPDIELCAALYILVGLHFDIHDEEFHKICSREIAEGNGIIHEFVKNYMIPRIVLLDKTIQRGVQQGIFEISNTLIFTICLTSFISHFAHGEDFFKDTEFYDELYSDKKEKLYNFVVEMSFKSLRPSGKALKIPVLDNEKKERLNQILKNLDSLLEKL
ncbi:MAG TPA: TetR/AcrR family transcriptional regulator [Spirochaetota bacterium]|nr:TetR/AcrR family transcriptional regulator [Spirochaetota bacterium]